MSEIQGTLLGIVLAIAVFGIVFGVITIAVNESAHDISDSIDEQTHATPNFEAAVAKPYNLVY